VLHRPFLGLPHAEPRGQPGELDEEVTEMTSSGSGSQFLLRRERAGRGGGCSESEGEGRKRGVR
jgi:hypothetical protein